MMKRSMALLTILLFLLGLGACTPQPAEPTVLLTEPTAPPSSPTELPTTTPPTEAPTEAPTVAETAPPHSPLYIPVLDVEDTIRYFNEVCLDAEYQISGDASVLQKWLTPIDYTINGAPTDEDLTMLTDFTAWLNTIDGFPGMAPANDPDFANLRIHFCTQQELLDLMDSSYTDLDGAMTFWYDDNAIFDAIICIRTDLDQYVRNSVILEEIYNVLGPAQDTVLRTDSIIYSEYSEPQELTDVDKLILKLLYHPDLQCGMNADECETVIRQLYN